MSKNKLVTHTLGVVSSPPGGWINHFIMGAIFGLLLIIFSVFLLRLIGFEIIKIPGFE